MLNSVHIVNYHRLSFLYISVSIYADDIIRPMHQCESDLRNTVRPDGDDPLPRAGEGETAQIIYLLALVTLYCSNYPKRCKANLLCGLVSVSVVAKIIKVIFY